MMTIKVLVLEDDTGINDLIAMQLKAEGYEVTQVYDGQEAIETFNNTYSLAILDIMVPKKDGFEVLVHIRKKSVIPIIFLTARNDDVNKIRALGLGADDYVTKPFSIIEVVYRCKAHIRRYTSYSSLKQTDDSVVYGDIFMRKSTFEVKLKGVDIALSVKEFELLSYFIENPGCVFTKQQLYEHVWATDYYGDTNTIMVHISKIRDKLNDDSKKPRYIKTIKGLGYRMEKQ